MNDNFQNEPPEKSQTASHRNGKIQIAVWIVFILISGVLIYLVSLCSVKPYDALLLGGTFLAIVIAITCGQAYNYPVGNLNENSLLKRAIKSRNTFLHANFAWQTINIWMTITPLYCTCTTIYLSGSLAFAENNTHILVYSILSLVTSLSIYVIRPANRAAGYRTAYTILNKTLNEYAVKNCDEKAISEAIAEGEKIIAEQDIGP